MQIGVIPVVPLTAAIFMLPFARREKVTGTCSLIATFLTLISAFWLFMISFSSPSPLTYEFGGWKPPIGILFEVDRLSSTLVLVAAFGFFLTSVYSIKFLSGHDGAGYFQIFLLGLEAGVLGAFMTGDAFNLFVMLETVGAAAYGIVGFYRYRGDSMEAAFKYGMSGAMATSMYFLAVGFIYATFGTLNMAELSHRFHITGFTQGLAVFFALTISMVIVKSAVFPGHYWLPDAYQGAPIPAIAVLSGFVEVVGIYVLARYEFTVFSGSFMASLIFIAVGTATAILGSLMMLIQRDVKRIIAYSTILHMGYLLMTLGVTSRLALTALTLHVVNHAVAKMLLVFTVGSFVYAAGTSNVEKLKGLGREMPATTFLLGLATMNLVGVPPLNVFFGKMLIYDALMQKSPLLGAVIIATSAMAAWTYIKVLVILWRETSDHGRINENRTFLAVSSLLAVLVVALGLLAPVLISHVFEPAAVHAMNWRSYQGG